jgi:hypothetical protein
MGNSRRETPYSRASQVAEADLADPLVHRDEHDVRDPDSADAETLLFASGVASPSELRLEWRVERVLSSDAHAPVQPLVVDLVRDGLHLSLTVVADQDSHRVKAARIREL